MIKVQFGKKGKEESLRPLTEKEIQEKLYGAYQADLDLREALEEKLAETVATEKESRPVQEKLSPPTPPKKKPKVSFRFPWGKILGALGRFFKLMLVVLWNFFKAVFGKVSNRWGAGLLVVALLFIGIHSLNAYRAQAMKNPPAPPPTAPSPQKISISKKAPVLPVSIATPSESEPARPEPLAEDSAVKPPVVKKTPPAVPPDSLKPYVIQICSYSREEDAQQLTQQMVQSRFPAFYQGVDRANGKVFYLVFLGRYQTFPEAQAKLDEFRKNPVAKDFSDSFVRTL